MIQLKIFGIICLLIYLFFSVQMFIESIRERLMFWPVFGPCCRWLTETVECATVTEKYSDKIKNVDLWWLAGIFEDDQVTHVEGDVNPVRDMEIIHEELRLKDLEYLDRTIDHMERVVVRGGDKSRKAEYVWCFASSFDFC